MESLLESLHGHNNIGGAAKSKGTIHSETMLSHGTARERCCAGKCARTAGLLCLNSLSAAGHQTFGFCKDEQQSLPGFQSAPPCVEQQVILACATRILAQVVEQSLLDAAQFSGPHYAGSNFHENPADSPHRMQSASDEP